MNATELEGLWKGGQKVFAGADLRSIQLSSAHLPRAVFIGADLRQADLHGADLRPPSSSAPNSKERIWLRQI